MGSQLFFHSMETPMTSSCRPLQLSSMLNWSCSLECNACLFELTLAAAFLPPTLLDCLARDWMSATSSLETHGCDSCSHLPPPDSILSCLCLAHCILDSKLFPIIVLLCTWSMLSWLYIAYIFLLLWLDSFPVIASSWKSFWFTTINTCNGKRRNSPDHLYTCS